MSSVESDKQDNVDLTWTSRNQLTQETAKKSNSERPDREEDP